MNEEKPMNMWTCEDCCEVFFDEDWVNFDNCPICNSKLIRLCKNNKWLED